MATTQVSLDEYLRTDYEPDCDYIDGEWRSAIWVSKSTP